MALLSENTTCEASTPVDRPWSCNFTLDGDFTQNHAYVWAFRGDPQNQWIKINFPRYYNIGRMRLLQGDQEEDMNLKAIRIVPDHEEFSREVGTYMYTNTN